MHRKIVLTSLVSLVWMCFATQPAAHCSPRSLSKAELLALVGGDILPENVAFDIQARGLAFVPHASYKSLLKSAGADAKVFAANPRATLAGYLSSKNNSVRTRPISSAS
jgi:NAD-dependent DNA ligase